MPERHGYGAYSSGLCRCDVCRKAKAEYTRARRHAAYEQAEKHTDDAGYHFVPGITHGRFGYEEKGCRCPGCVAAYRKERREYHHRKRAVAS